jgi:hypothetical protein
MQRGCSSRDLLPLVGQRNEGSDAVPRRVYTLYNIVLINNIVLSYML